MLAKRNVKAKIESQLKSTAKSKATAKDSKGEGEIKMIIMCTVYSVPCLPTAANVQEDDALIRIQNKYGTPAL